MASPEKKTRMALPVTRVVDSWTEPRSNLIVALFLSPGSIRRLGGSLQFLVRLRQKLSCFLCMTLHVISIVLLRGCDITVGFGDVLLRRRQIWMYFLVDVYHGFLRCNDHAK